MHHCVLVIHPDSVSVDDVLAPFDENLVIEKVVEDDDYEYWYNPKGKWDWYQIGGRWTGSLKLKDDVKATSDMYGEPSLLLEKGVDPYFHARNETWVDSALIKDIDMSLDMRAYEIACKNWDKAMEGEVIDLFTYKEGLLKEYVSKENYAILNAMFYFTYVIDHEGEWHQLWDETWQTTLPNRLEWAQKFWTNFIRPIINSREPYRLTVVDIHS